MQEKLVWVKIVFPAHFTPEILEELHAGINIVPVENKLLHEQTTSLEDTFRVIPCVPAITSPCCPCTA